MNAFRLFLIGVWLLSGCTLIPASVTESPPAATSTAANLVGPSASQSATYTPGSITTSAPFGLEGQRFDMVEECSRTVAALRAYQTGFPLPEGFSTNDPVQLPIPGGLDLNHYFTILDQLNVEDGYRLDYVFVSDFLGSKPLVYAHPISDPAYASYDEYVQALAKVDGDENPFAYLDDVYEYLMHIQMNTSPQSAFQFVVLRLAGDQFYLYWHALYHDEIILCDVQDIELVGQEIEGFGIPIPEEDLERAQALDLQPYVIVGEDGIAVRMVVFTKWGGFIEVQYLYSASFPHELLDTEFNTLIEYDCGVMF